MQDFTWKQGYTYDREAGVYLEGSGVWNPMTDTLIHRCADTFGETAIAER
jgi:hypothetical protein